MVSKTPSSVKFMAIIYQAQNIFGAKSFFLFNKIDQKGFWTNFFLSNISQAYIVIYIYPFLCKYSRGDHKKGSHGKIVNIYNILFIIFILFSFFSFFSDLSFHHEIVIFSLIYELSSIISYSLISNLIVQSHNFVS